jgi:hypothetical protein
MKQDTQLLQDKEITIICEKSIEDAHNYQNLMEPPTPQKVDQPTKSRNINVVCGHYKKPRHLKKNAIGI